MNMIGQDQMIVNVLCSTTYRAAVTYCFQVYTDFIQTLLPQISPLISININSVSTVCIDNRNMAEDKLPSLASHLWA